MGSLWQKFRSRVKTELMEYLVHARQSMSSVFLHKVSVQIPLELLRHAAV